VHSVVIEKIKKGEAAVEFETQHAASCNEAAELAIAHAPSTVACISATVRLAVIPFASRMKNRK